MLVETVAVAGLIVAGDKLECPIEQKLAIATVAAILLIWVRQNASLAAAANAAEASHGAKASPPVLSQAQSKPAVNEQSAQDEAAARLAAEAARAAEQEAKAWHRKRQQLLEEAKAAEVRLAAERAAKQSVIANQARETPEKETPDKQTPEKHSPRSLGDKISSGAKSLGDSAKRRLSIRKTHQVAPAAADCPASTPAPDEGSPLRRPIVRDSGRSSHPERRASESFCLSISAAAA